MNEKVARVTDVSRIMAYIMTARDEQSAGIGQIVKAVFQMAADTQQNAASVQEALEVATSLQERAEALEALLRIFQVDSAWGMAKRKVRSLRLAA